MENLFSLEGKKVILTGGAAGLGRSIIEGMHDAGAEVAMEAADIALADSNLEGLMTVRNLSHQTMKVID